MRFPSKEVRFSILFFMKRENEGVIFRRSQGTRSRKSSVDREFCEWECVCELVHGHHFYSGFRTWSSSSTSVGPRPRNFHISCLHMSITCIFEEVTFTLWWHKRFSTQLKIKVCRWEIGDATWKRNCKKIFLVVSLAQYYMYSRRVWGVPVGIERDEKSPLICKSFWSVWGEGKKLAAKCKALFFSSSTFLKKILKNPPQGLKISSCSNEFV